MPNSNKITFTWRILFILLWEGDNDRANLSNHLHVPFAIILPYTEKNISIMSSVSLDRFWKDLGRDKDFVIETSRTVIKG